MLAVSDFDCTGCGSCAESCPAKAAHDGTRRPDRGEKERWDFARAISDKGETFDRWTVKGSQFRQPLVEILRRLRRLRRDALREA
jgi:pyruvate-ferredoxin/flavodoxin oxidoreductase